MISYYLELPWFLIGNSYYIAFKCDPKEMWAIHKKDPYRSWWVTCLKFRSWWVGYEAQ